MQDADIHAFTPPPVATAAKPRRSRAAWVLGGLALLMFALVVATTLVLLGLVDSAREGITFIVDGHPWHLIGSRDWDIDEHVVLKCLVAALVVVIVVPLVVLTGLLCAALAVAVGLLAGALGLAVGLGCVLLALAVGLSPLWGLGLVLWLLLRPSKKSSPGGAAAV
jgi:thiosulfate reductase cytochrome b subunit